MLESKSLASYWPNIPPAQPSPWCHWRGRDWLLMEPSCLEESNIITIFAFVFTQPQNCIKPQLYFYFLSAGWLKNEELPRKSSGFMPWNISAKLSRLVTSGDHLALTARNQNIRFIKFSSDIRWWWHNALSFDICW